jgi:uncharacterized HAD superfamily protein
VNIGIDIDGVCACYCEAALQWLNEKLELNYTMSQMTTYWFETIITEVSQDVVHDALVQFRDEGNLRYLPVVPGAQEAIWKLSDNNKIIFVTARNVCAREDTEEWLCKNGIHYDDLVFTGCNEKAEFIKSHCDVHIDDCPEIANKVSAKNIPVLLFDQIWNRDYIPVIESRMVVRARDWPDVVSIIGGIPCGSRRT